MNVLELFAGAGGGVLGSRLLGHRTVCAVEKDSYCREVLLRRQEEGHLEPFPIWPDVRTFDGRPWRGVVDIVAAGFPCQPFSVAGKQRGEDDERNMWPDTLRVIREVGPRFSFLENVPGLVSSGYFGTVLGDLAEAGFDAVWGIVSAAEVGAPHVRKRLWVLAYTQSTRARENESGLRKGAGLYGQDGAIPDADRQRQANAKGSRAPAPQEWDETFGLCRWWEAEPDVGRVVDGMAFRLDRLTALGNGQVPRVVVEAWNRFNEARERLR